jgi:hypothetical protein
VLAASAGGEHRPRAGCGQCARRHRGPCSFDPILSVPWPCAGRFRGVGQIGPCSLPPSASNALAQIADGATERFGHFEIPSLAEGALASFPCLDRVTGDAEPRGELPWRQAGAQAHMAHRESTSERPRPIFFPHNLCPPGPPVQRRNKISVALARFALALSACTSERQAPWRAEQPTTPQPPPPTTPPPAKK